MNAIYYIGLDIHKKTIAYCIKKVDGTLVRQRKWRVSGLNIDIIREPGAIKGQADYPKIGSSITRRYGEH